MVCKRVQPERPSSSTSGGQSDATRGAVVRSADVMLVAFVLDDLVWSFDILAQAPKDVHERHLYV